MVALPTGFMPDAVRATAVPVKVIAPPPPPGVSMLASAPPPSGASTFAGLLSPPPQAARATNRSEQEKAACLIPHSYSSRGRVTEGFGTPTLSATSIRLQRLA